LSALPALLLVLGLVLVLGLGLSLGLSLGQGETTRRKAEQAPLQQALEMVSSLHASLAKCGR